MNVKQKGSAGEREWAKFLRDNNLDTHAVRNYTSGSTYKKSDVHNSMGYIFEVKRVEKLNLWKAEDQAQRDADSSQAIPSVPHRRNNGDWWISVPAWHFADLYKKAREPKTINPDKELKWKLENMIKAIKAVLKIIS